MIVRPATIDDIPALCRLMQHVQALHARAHPERFKRNVDTERQAAVFGEALSNERHLILVASSKAAIRGYIWCQEHVVPETAHANAAHVGYINHVSVEPRARRHGIGRALLQRALLEMEGRGVDRVGLDFWSFNKRAQAFFTDMGFAVERQVCSKRFR